MSSLYLFTGPELGECSEAINQLKLKIEKKYKIVDFHLFYANETSVADVIMLLMNGSLFSNSCFVVLKNAELIKKKEEIALIEEWLKTSEESSVLILVSEEISIDKKLEKIVPEPNKKIFWEMFQNKKEQWLKTFFKENGFILSEKACDAILDMVENNKNALQAECSKIFACFEKGHTVTEDDVYKIMDHNREENAFTLFEAMSSVGTVENRLDLSLAILQKIRLGKGSSSVALIAGLTYCFRKLKLWHSLVMSGHTAPFDLKKNGFSSKKVQEQNRQAAKIWSLEDCMRILSLLADADMQIRSTGTALEENTIILLIYSIVKKNGLSLQPYVVE